MEAEEPDELRESSEEAIERAREDFMAIKRIEEYEGEILKDREISRMAPRADRSAPACSSAAPAAFDQE